MTYSHKAGREVGDCIVLEVPSGQENLLHLLIERNLTGKMYANEVGVSTGLKFSNNKPFGDYQPCLVNITIVSNLR